MDNVVCIAMRLCLIIYNNTYFQVSSQFETMSIRHNFKWQCKVHDGKWSNYNNELGTTFENTPIGKSSQFKSKNGMINTIHRIAFDTASHTMQFNHDNSQPRQLECRRIIIESNNQYQTNKEQHTESNPVLTSLPKNKIHHEVFSKQMILDTLEDDYKVTKKAFIMMSFFAILLIISSIGVIIASGFVYDAGTNRPYVIEGKCIITSDVRSRDKKRSVDFKIYMNSLEQCDHRASNTFVMTTECTQGDENGCFYQIGDIVPCYTDEHCADVIVNTEQDSRLIGLVIAAVCMDIFALVCCCLSAVNGRSAYELYHCDANGSTSRWWKEKFKEYPRKLALLEDGSYKREHDIKEWDKMKSLHKLDYVLSLYSREYGLQLYGNIGDILTKWVDPDA